MKKTIRLPTEEQQSFRDQLRVRLLEPFECLRFEQLLEQHHYLGNRRPVGERLHDVVMDGSGQWLGGTGTDRRLWPVPH